MAELELFAACPPGLEGAVAEELAALGCGPGRRQKGGVAFTGGWAELARANLGLRCATRVLLRLAAFGAPHLAQLDRRARRLDWAAWLPAGAALRASARCSRSRIYHSRAAAERVERAAAAATGGRVVRGRAQPAIEIQLRIVRDRATLSLDSSGAPLWRRGHKQEVTAAPLREHLAAAALRLAGYDGGEPLLDPLCGSGSFLLEAAEMALGRAPGLARDFACQAWPACDRDAWQAERRRLQAAERQRPAAAIFGSDRSGGAVGVSRRNLRRAGLEEQVALERRPLEQLEPPAAAGLWICNPPYGGRLGGAETEALHRSIGRVARERFSGWRVALLTAREPLARATGLDFTRVSPPLAHGGLEVRLYQTAVLD
jgi:putative N6-adenine-specific DNA methylase